MTTTATVRTERSIDLEEIADTAIHPARKQSFFSYLIVGFSRREHLWLLRDQTQDQTLCEFAFGLVSVCAFRLCVEPPTALNPNFAVVESAPMFAPDAKWFSERCDKIPSSESRVLVSLREAV